MDKRFALNHAEGVPLETARDRWSRVVTGARLARSAPERTGALLWPETLLR